MSHAQDLNVGDIPEKVSRKDEVASASDRDGLSDEVAIDPVKEAKMMRKFDLYAIGTLGLFYLFANLDRSNIGNANIAGMPKDIGLVGNQFGTAVTLLYATYVPFEAPVAVLLKIIGPKYLLTGCAFAWSLITLCMGFIQNWHGLYACRLLMGLFEAGLIPCIDVYVGMVYKKSERGKRMGFIFAFSAIASGFGGILAFGLTQINGPNGFEGWRWLFVVEGILSLACVPLFFFVFPTSPTDAWFLTPDEKTMMRLRYELEPHWGVDDVFQWSDVLDVIKDPRWYCFFAYQFSVDISLYGFTTFLPAILKGMGYTSIYANLLTVPIYAWGLITYLAMAYFSDRLANRSYFMLAACLCLVVGYAILLSVDSVGVRYFACYIVVTGIYPTTGLSISWINDVVAKHFKRASMIGMTLMLGNCAGVAVGQVFQSNTAPRYKKPIGISMGLAAVAALMVVLLTVYMTAINKKREGRIRRAEEMGEPLAHEPEKGDQDVHFKFTF